MCLLSHSVVSDSVTSWTVARQAPLSMGLSRQERWSGLPCPPPGDRPDSGIEHRQRSAQPSRQRGPGSRPWTPSLSPSLYHQEHPHRRKHRTLSCAEHPAAPNLSLPQFCICFRIIFENVIFGLQQNLKARAKTSRTTTLLLSRRHRMLECWLIIAGDRSPYLVQVSPQVLFLVQGPAQDTGWKDESASINYCPA